ncbi:fibulin-2-like [Spea bombifrons]|uniref:fibulin-2-like n=1 Tax=Spea bombifrons TaxID=233779 RepID=UPI00234ADCBC|nr:fibulin-2-like [Spea bombifrons]
MVADLHLDTHRGFLSFAILILTGTKLVLAQNDCTGVECQPLVNCIEEVKEEGSCCPTCAQFGCTCEGYQYYDCLNVGFKDGKVPEGESYFVDFGSTECSCPSGGGRISCDFIPCPELPPNCIDIIQPVDGCVQCGRIGCTHGDEKYEAGYTFHMSLCKFCHCPNTGGELMCYDIPDCDLELDNSTPHTDTLDGDLDKQYDYPYSHEQDSLELANTEFVEKTNNYKRNAMLEDSILDYDDDMDETLQSLSTTVQPVKLTDFTTIGNEMHLSSERTRLGVSDVTVHTTESSTTTASTTLTTTTESLPTIKPTTATTPPMTTYKTTRAPTDTSTARMTSSTVILTTSKGSDDEITTTQPDKQDVMGSHNQTQVMPKEEEFPSVSSPGNTTTNRELGKLDLQINNEKHTISPLSKDVFPEEEERGSMTLDMKSTPASVLPIAVEESHSQTSLTELNTHLTQDLDKWGLPNDILNNSRPYEGSSKDLIETCCTEGQQWSIDNGECENMPSSASEDCRLVKKQCCTSYLKENTCIAGMVAAKEDGICFPAENDMCQRSYFKLCCDCCSLGLKLRREGHSCESNLNLGYPCNNMMILCCNGEEQLIAPDINVPLKPEPTLAPKRDIDECVQNKHTCVKGERCINTVGSFVCIQEVICDTGYTLADGICKDIDECVQNKHTCVKGERCINTVGSFVCIKEVMCDTGYTLADGICKDIDECAATQGPCKQGFNCLNTMGSYVCQKKQLNCKRGYKSDENGTICLDIDECKTGAHNCSNEQSCYNLPGTYRCDCKMGYRYDSIRKSCIDINECWIYPGRLCHHTCENTVGSYKCSCFAGFQLADDGKRCEDVNECEKNPCNQECTNVYGSYQCYCKEGYKLGVDGISCEDIDECVQGLGSHCVFACVNTPGSYQCACPETGYTKSANGLSCKDIDECEIGTHNCTSTEECYNVHGSYKCLSYECPENYRRVSNTQCERITCFNYQDCQNTPVRISYHRLNFPVNVMVPAQIFRIGPSPAYAGDNILMDIKKGNEENYFSARKFNPYTGILHLQRPIKKSKDFLLDVEMKLFRQGVVTTFLSRIYIFITSPTS